MQSENGKEGLENIKAKNEFFEEKYDMNNRIKLSEIDEIRKNLDNIHERNYYEKEAKICQNNMQHIDGDIQDEEAKIRKFLQKRYSLDLMVRLKKSRFKNIHQCLIEFERELDIKSD